MTTAAGDTLFGGVAYSEFGYTEVPSGDYAVRIQADTESSDGGVVADFDEP